MLTVVLPALAVKVGFPSPSVLWAPSWMVSALAVSVVVELA